jgi:hypothetical protein
MPAHALLPLLPCLPPCRLQRAYRQLASVFHPDKHADEELRVQAQEAFSRLQVGWAVKGGGRQWECYGPQSHAARSGEAVD